MPDRAANREQAHRCVELARESIRSGDFGRAERLLAKSLRLCATDEATLLLESVRRSGAARDEAKGQQRRQARREDAAPKKASVTNPEIIGILRRRDYYEILQIRRDCTAVEIKKAYRKMALKFHPDKCQDAGAEDVFKLINKAYECLSDEQKRRQYNQVGPDGMENNQRGPMHGFRFHGGRSGYRQFEQDISPEDLFDLFFNGAQRQRAHPQFRRRQQHQGVQFQFGPAHLIMLIVGFLFIVSFSPFSPPQPAFSMQRTPAHSMKRQTATGVPYFTNAHTSHFMQRNAQTRRNVEQSVMQEHVAILKRQCAAEAKEQGYSPQQWFSHQGSHDHRSSCAHLRDLYSKQ